MTPQQAADWLLHTDTSDALDTAAAFDGVIELTPPDYLDTERTRPSPSAPTSTRVGEAGAGAAADGLAPQPAVPSGSLGCVSA